MDHMALRSSHLDDLTEEGRQEKLLHLLQVSRDCVDVQLVRWALQLPAYEDIHGFLAARRKLCGSSSKTGLVKRIEATPAPSSQLREHPEIAALDHLIHEVMAVFLENGNVHVPYWRLETLIEWSSAIEYANLRDYFTLPRLLAFFSLFDHNFQRRTCALSMRNYAVWGAEKVVKGKLLQWQGGNLATPLAREDLTAPPLSFVGEIPQGRQLEMQSGEFFSILEVMRAVKWSNGFAPHVGDFLEWIWRTPGLELGVRISSATYALKDVRLEDKDYSEKAALRALASHLEKRNNLSDHISACRQGLNWREYGLGPLDKFVRKYAAWFSLDGERISLLPDKVGSQHTGPSERSDAPATADGLSAELTDIRIGPDVDDEQVDSGDDADSAEDDVVDSLLSPCAHVQDHPAGITVAPRRPPSLFRIRDGVAYHEACLQEALNAAKADLSISPYFLPQPCVDIVASLGIQVDEFARDQCFQEQDWLHRQALQNTIQDALRSAESLQSKYPRLRVIMFGTSASGLGQQKSDVDLLLDLDGQGNRDIDRVHVPGLLDGLSLALDALGATMLERISDARVPLLRGQLNNLRFDLSIGPPCGWWNTNLLRHCAMHDPSVVIPLCVTVAAWSKARRINDSPNGLLSTYSVMLMVVFFLQVVGVVPVMSLNSLVQDSFHEHHVPYGQFSTWSKPTTDEAATRLGRLLIGFFQFFACFRWDAWVVSVRCGAPLLRTQKTRAWHVFPLCIEDPFETHLNTCRRVNPRGQRQVLTGIFNALRTLKADGQVSSLLGAERARNSRAVLELPT